MLSIWKNYGTDVLVSTTFGIAKVSSGAVMGLFFCVTRTRDIYSYYFKKL